MNVTIVAGYGDGTAYIQRLTRHWSQKYDLQPTVVAFGTLDPPETYDAHWQEFIANLKPGPIIGISFGFSVAARALLEHPDKVPKIVSISGPHDLGALNPVTVDTKYPMIKRSLSTFKSSDLPTAKIMTISPWWDSVIAPDKVMITGARNQRVPVAGHGFGIAAALMLKGRAIANFLHQD